MRIRFQLSKIMRIFTDPDPRPRPCRLINFCSTAFEQRRFIVSTLWFKFFASVICTVDSHKCILYNNKHLYLLDNGLCCISSPKAPDPLQNGTGTGMMTISINVSAFMVLPDFLPPTSGTFFLMGASHIRPSFWTFHLRIQKRHWYYDDVYWFCHRDLLWWLPESLATSDLVLLASFEFLPYLLLWT